MIYFIIGFIVVAVFVLLLIWSKNNKSKNKVHFYVARDKYESLWLYLGKPIRVEHMFVKGHGRALVSSYGFQDFGLNENNYKDLKWEDEPLEVFINIED